MTKRRLIPVLILRDGAVVQSVKFQHTNVIHWKPVTAIDFFNKWAVDEIVVLDVSRDMSNRDKFCEVVEGLSLKCFVPMTVGGWARDVDEIRKLLRLGGDKVVINTEAVRRPSFLSEAAKSFGRQCLVVSIDAKHHGDANYEVFVDRGREPTGLVPWEWAKEAEEAGAGEILLNCIDRDGNRQGYDLDLLGRVVSSVSIPVIAFGGVFHWRHLAEGIAAGADAVAAANIFHYTEHATKKAKEFLRQEGVEVR